MDSAAPRNALLAPRAVATQVDALAGGLQHLGNQGAGGAFALGACNADNILGRADSQELINSCRDFILYASIGGKDKIWV